MFLPDDVVESLLDALGSGGPTRWLGLSTTVPTLSAAGYGNVTEPSAPSYARVQVDPSDWAPAAGRAVQVVVQIPDPVADLGVVVAWVLFDADSGGVAKLAGEPAAPIDLLAGTSNVEVTCRIEAPDNLTAAF